MLEESESANAVLKMLLDAFAVVTGHAGRSAGAEPYCRDASQRLEFVRSSTVGWLGTQIF
ncbi:MAG TPA: hypothetical protein VN044_03870 [Verrucomicrobiae bacterium]|nr:hypothetical protein [Verrucomicrobiae bacterium]